MHLMIFRLLIKEKKALPKFLELEFFFCFLVGRKGWGQELIYVWRGEVQSDHF